MRQQLKDDNLVLAQQQGAAKAFMETSVFPNAINEDFFTQFNTTSR